MHKFCTRFIQKIFKYIFNILKFLGIFSKKILVICFKEQKLCQFLNKKNKFLSKQLTKKIQFEI